jgi:hypothetical protein
MQGAIDVAHLRQELAAANERERPGLLRHVQLRYLRHRWLRRSPTIEAAALLRAEEAE